MANKYRLNPYDGDIFLGGDLKLFCNATKEVDKKERFSLVNSDPVLITIAVTEVLSYFYWNKTCMITTVYSDTGVGSSYVDIICNQENLSQKQVRNVAAINWAAVTYVSNFTTDMFSRSILLPRNPIAQSFNVALDPK